MPKKSVRRSKKKSPRKVRKIRSPKMARCIKDPFGKNALMFSQEDIENLMNGAPALHDPKDGPIIKKRLKKFLYDPSYTSEFFRHDVRGSVPEKMFLQAAARLAEYGKRYLHANEI